MKARDHAVQKRHRNQESVEWLQIYCKIHSDKFLVIKDFDDFPLYIKALTTWRTSPLSEVHFRVIPQKSFMSPTVGDPDDLSVPDFWEKCPQISQNHE